MKSNIYFGLFMILLGSQFICIIEPLKFNMGLTPNYVPSILIIILGILQILIPFLYSIYGNHEDSK